MKRLITLVFIVMTASAFGQDQWEFSLAPRILGITADARYALTVPEADEVETSITGLVSTAYESQNYYRNPDGSLFTTPADGTDPEITGYNRYDLLWQFGAQQGLFPRSDSRDDLAVGYLLYRGQYSVPFDESGALLFQSALPEEGPTLRGSVLGGIALSRVLLNPITRVRSGIEGELSLEWGPAWMHNQILGEADYTRSTLSGSGFLPLYVAEPEDGRNRFALYLASFAMIDWNNGPEVPLEIRGTTGGRNPRTGTGGSVRGYGSKRFDATFKAIGNLELRASLPAIGRPDIVPGLVIYTDAGYFLDELDTSPAADENSGLLVSSGAGISIEMFDSVQLVFYTNLLWTETDVEGDRYVPVVPGFGFHF